ncbi:MAG: tetratricopeptide (TPR) repeat protein [Bradymonadia bacterium]
MRHWLLLAVVGLAACGGPIVTVGPAPDVDLVDSDSYEAFLRSQLLADLRYWDESAAELRRAVEHDADAPTLHLALARVLVYVDDSLNEGLVACNLAEDLGADAADVTLARASMHASQGESSDAYEVFAAHPGEHARQDVYIAWIALAEANDDPAQMLVGAQAFTEILPENSTAWRSLGYALRSTDLVASAEAFGNALNQPSPEPSDAYLQLDLLVQAEQWDDALAASVSCREQFWEYWPCTAWQAYLLDRDAVDDGPVSEATRGALSHLAFMVSVDSRQLAQSGAELRTLGRDPLVRAYARTVAETRPFNASVITSAAWIANAIEDFPLAIELMERVLALDDSNFDALNYIGYSWAELGENLDQAEVYIREALFLRGENGHMLDSLAWVYYRRGQFEEALEIQFEALELVDDNAVIWDHLGDIHLQLGDREEALDAWRRALDYADEYSEDVLEDATRKIEEHSPLSK